MTTGDRIRELREGRHMTQQQLADLANVAKPTVCMWEKGTRMPSRISLEMLCDIFNVQMDYISCREDVTMRYLDREEMEIIDAYRSMQYDQQSLVCNMLGVKRDAELSNSRAV